MYICALSGVFVLMLISNCFALCVSCVCVCVFSFLILYSLLVKHVSCIANAMNTLSLEPTQQRLFNYSDGLCLVSRPLSLLRRQSVKNHVTFGPSLPFLNERVITIINRRCEYCISQGIEKNTHNILFMICSLIVYSPNKFHIKILQLSRVDYTCLFTLDNDSLGNSCFTKFALLPDAYLMNVYWCQSTARRE